MKYNAFNTRVISRKDIQRNKLRHKVKCPVCQHPLAFVYQNAGGLITEKCNRCRNEIAINLTNLDTLMVVDEPVVS